MSPTPGLRPDAKRELHHGSRQRSPAQARGGVPAPAVRPARPVRLQFSRGQVPHNPAAACAGRDPDLWFSDSPDDIARAQAICRGCPGQLPCLSGALERRETYGIWGATDFNPAHQRKDVA
jgi:hypothetical protein